MIKKILSKLMNWERPRESNWTKANKDIGVIERNVVMNKAQQDLKEEQRKIIKQQKNRESKREDTEEETRMAA